jgi:hypothetical protein
MATILDVRQPMIKRVVIGCCAVFALALAVHGEETKETRFKPTMVFTGTHSAIRYETYQLISTGVGWKELWEQHRGDENDRLFTESYQGIDINFETHYVVAIFIGGYPDGCEIIPLQSGDTIIIVSRGMFFQTEGRTPKTADDPLPRTPDLRQVHNEAKANALGSYAFVVLPKPVKTVVLADATGSPRDGPLNWKQRFIFPAPKGK